MIRREFLFLIASGVLLQKAEEVTMRVEGMV